MLARPTLGIIEGTREKNGIGNKSYGYLVKTRVKAQT